MNAPFNALALLEERFDYDELLVAPSRERRRLQCYIAMILGDMFSIFFGFCFVGYLLVGQESLTESLKHAQVLVPIFLTIAIYNGAYSKEALQKSWTGIWRSCLAMVIAVAVAVFVLFVTQPQDHVSRWGFTGGAMLVILTMAWTRLQMRSFVYWRCGRYILNELIIDDGGPQVNLQGAIRVSPAAMGIRPSLNNPNSLDRLGLLLRNIDRVVVSCPASRRVEWAMILKGADIEGEILDDEVAKLGAQGARVVGKYGLLLVSAGPLGLRDRAMKRAFDVTFASAALIALSPILLAVAIAVKLQDGGPIFFKQRRMGRGNRYFNMYKFRSMSQALCDTNGSVSASKGDQRITSIGRFIRGTSIDELPQLFNVLLGDMSLVGPRPHATGSLAGDKLFWQVDSRYWQRHSLKPGLSGLAQVRGFRGATDHESDLVNRLQADLEYLEGWSITRDIKILCMTLRVLVHDRAF